MTALYTITSQYLALAEKLADGDFDAQTVADTIEASGITDELAVKAAGIEYIARGAEAHNLAIDAEISRLQALKAQRNRVAAGLRAYLLDNMQRAGIERIDCPLFTLSIKRNPPAVDVFDALSIPSEYMRQAPPPPPAIDKAAIKKAIAAGQEVPGARLSQAVRLDVK